MTNNQRTPETCPFRVPVSGESDDTTATCQLLVQLSGTDGLARSEISRDACAACCETFEPSAADLNPVVASLLIHLTDEIISQDGVTGCSREKAIELQSFAEESLPAVLADEDDLVAPPSYAERLQTVSVDDLAIAIPLPATPKKIDIKWAVGITTCERRISTLAESVDSLVTAGWNEYRVFVDGPMELPQLAGKPEVTTRTPASGAWSNYYLSLAELYQRQPDADAFLLIQDDSLFARVPTLRQYVERVLSATDQTGIASLYCSADDTRQHNGWFRYEGKWLYGALAFVYTNPAVTDFLAHDYLLQRSKLAGVAYQAGIDSVIGEWAAATDTDVWYSTPSLVQHLGDVSTIWKTSRAVGLRRASSFIETELG